MARGGYLTLLLGPPYPSWRTRLFRRTTVDAGRAAQGLLRESAIMRKSARAAAKTFRKAHHGTPARERLPPLDTARRLIAEP